MTEARYVYCLVGTSGPLQLPGPGVGERPEELVVLAADKMGALVSRCRPEECVLNRSNLLGHQRAMEQAMQKTTVLPVRFGTLAQGNGHREVEELIRSRLLGDRRAEIAELLEQMEGRCEFSVRALWKDLDGVLGGLRRDDPDIRRLLERIGGRPEAATRPERIRLGGLVKERLDRARARLAGSLMAALAGVACRTAEHTPLGDRMVLNAALLVEPRAAAGLQEILARLGRAHPELSLRGAGPMPPSSFVNLVISWD